MKSSNPEKRTSKIDGLALSSSELFRTQAYSNKVEGWPMCERLLLEFPETLFSKILDFIFSGLMNFVFSGLLDYICSGLLDFIFSISLDLFFFKDCWISFFSRLLAFNFQGC